MRRNRDIEKKDRKSVRKKDDEIESQWSLKRIAIFTTVVAVLLLAGFLFIRSRTGQVLGEREMSSKSDGPQIELPAEEDIEDILDLAEDSISNIDPNDIVSSQPQIQQAIENLQKLTNQDNLKKSICSAICSE